MKTLLGRIPPALTRSLVVALVVGVLVGVLVLVVGLTRGAEYQGRVSLLAGPAQQTEGPAPQYGEVVSLALPALVELARSPSVLQAAAPVSGYSPDELGNRVSVELVPASGLARLSVRAASAQQAGAAALAIAKSMIDADLLAPVGKLRTLDKQAETIEVAPDRLLVIGLALAAAVAAGVAAAAILRLRSGRGRADEEAVRRALSAAGSHSPVTLLREADPAVADRLAVLCRAAGKTARVLAATPALAEQAAKLSAGIPAGDQSEVDAGTAVIVVTHAGRTKQDELTAAVGVLPYTATLVAVVLA
ncbi:hypothetical protein [Amycolatopsis sp. H20-H5]|uniref:hypothetical protein n=1 Tax=Amycolatopsis sp. H20-H5 TaxID=3046309 RepID=UPI002DB95A07|nr:hypothetical protein [Amycolatopsis sp. H20-H5]MEC3977320.1 hypothetical protein [Amycolatopsis sp. H20-H5]